VFQNHESGLLPTPHRTSTHQPVSPRVRAVGFQFGTCKAEEVSQRPLRPTISQVTCLWTVCSATLGNPRGGVVHPQTQDYT
jgi:hypothetical protein